jgi:hypothetical protein
VEGVAVVEITIEVQLKGRATVLVGHSFKGSGENTHWQLNKELVTHLVVLKVGKSGIWLGWILSVVTTGVGMSTAVIVGCADD